jgi:hypothetical protein
MSFVKELDEPTADYIRFLDANYDQLRKKRRARVVLIWLDGDEGKLAAWANENDINKLPLSVVSSKNEKLKTWNINCDAAHTLILLKRRKVMNSYGDSQSPSAARVMSSSAIFD